MSVLEWMMLPYRRYAAFSGRSRRREYWLFVLFYFLVSAVVSAVFGKPVSQSGPFGFHYGIWLEQGSPGYWVSSVFSVLSLIPSLAVQVRRLHDIDRSGWWMLAWFVPLLGWVVMLVFLCLDGTAGANRYGNDPKGRGVVEVFR